MAEAAKWYVVHTYSGYENTVKATIEKTVETRHLQDLIHVVSIPMETVTEVTDNGPKTYDRKVFPGYVLVKMILTDESWYLVRNTRGCTGFVGPNSNKPLPLTDEEAAKMGVEKIGDENEVSAIEIDYAVGDSVRICEGPMVDFIGVVKSIEPEQNKVTVTVFMLGRETSVELELTQVESVKE